MSGRVINPEHEGWKRLSKEEQRRSDALSDFNRAEKARKSLRSLVLFWMGLSGVLLMTLAFVLVAWLWN